METERIGRLTEQQRVCLRMVYSHLTSKEIAPRLGIAPNSVDQHIKAAMRTLGVSDRRTAALILAQYEGRPAAVEMREPQASFDARTFGRPKFPIPLPILGMRPSALGMMARLGWITAILFAITLVVGVFLAGLEALSRMGRLW